MSSARTRVRARSIVGLYRETTIGTLPIEEVRADLDRLDIDPARATDFAKRLVDKTAEDAAAAALLLKLEETEVVDDEIADLEQAPIETVLSSLPDGIAPSAVAKAEVLAGEAEKTETDGVETAEEATVLPMKRRRLSVLGWGGSLVGVAACVLLFVAVGPDVLERAVSAKRSDPGGEGLQSAPAVAEQETDQAVSGDAAAAAADGDDTSPPAAEPRRLQQQAANAAAEAEKGAVSLEDTVAASDAEGADPAIATEVQSQSAVDIEEPFVEERAAASAREENPSTSVENADARLNAAASDGASKLAARFRAESQETAIISRKAARTPSHVPLLRPTPSEQGLALLDEAETQSRPASVGSAESVVTAGPAVQAAAEGNRLTKLPDNLTGAFVVDPDRLPADLIALADAQRDGRLAAKLGEASLRALGRKVLALIAFERDGKRVEAALIETNQAPEGASAVAQALIDAGAVGLQGWVTGFEILELPGSE